MQISIIYRVGGMDMVYWRDHIPVRGMLPRIYVYIYIYIYISEILNNTSASSAWLGSARLGSARLGGLS